MVCRYSKLIDFCFFVYSFFKLDIHTIQNFNDYKHSIGERLKIVEGERTVRQNYTFDNHRFTISEVRAGFNAFETDDVDAYQPLYYCPEKETLYLPVQNALVDVKDMNLKIYSIHAAVRQRILFKYELTDGEIDTLYRLGKKEKAPYQEEIEKLNELKKQVLENLKEENLFKTCSLENPYENIPTDFETAFKKRIEAWYRDDYLIESLRKAEIENRKIDGKVPMYKISGIREHIVKMINKNIFISRGRWGERYDPGKRSEYDYDWDYFVGFYDGIKMRVEKKGHKEYADSLKMAGIYINKKVFEKMSNYPIQIKKFFHPLYRFSENGEDFELGYVRSMFNWLGKKTPLEKYHEYEPSIEEFLLKKLKEENL